jgi:hypothetical protein
MSINQYKQYKNKEISLLDIKLQNIGMNKNEIKANTLTYLIENKKLILALIILTSGFITSEIILGTISVNAFNYKPEMSIDLFSQNSSSIGI